MFKYEQESKQGQSNKDNMNETKCNNNNDESWIEKCRKELIEIEERNLRTRALYWTQIVNRKTKEFNNKLNINLTVPFEQFLYEISNPHQHLGFLYSWKGLRSEKLMVMPTKYGDFQFKAKNWVCGRRAPNYANSLFPEMIHKAEQYAQRLSLHLFGKQNIEIINAYRFGLMYGYLSALCSAKITLNDRSKKTYLMFENSIKKEKNPTVKALQQYVNSNEFVNGKKFPHDLQSAASYFKVKYDYFLSSLQRPILELGQTKKMDQQRQYQQQQQQLYHINNNNNNNNNNYNNVNFINMNMNMDMNMNDNNHIKNRTINVSNNGDLCNLINGLMELQKQQESLMAGLANRVNQLEDVLTNDFNMKLNGNNNNQAALNNNTNNNNNNNGTSLFVHNKQSILSVNNNNNNPTDRLSFSYNNVGDGDFVMPTLTDTASSSTSTGTNISTSSSGSATSILTNDNRNNNNIINNNNINNNNNNNIIHLVAATNHHHNNNSNNNNCTPQIIKRTTTNLLQPIAIQNVPSVPSVGTLTIVNCDLAALIGRNIGGNIGNI